VSAPGGNRPRQPRPRPRTAEEEAFLAIGAGAHRWLIEAGAAGASRVRTKMARAVDLAAIAGRFAEHDLPDILDHLALAGAAAGVVVADDIHSAQPGTASWAAFGGPEVTR
jgi:hypothetical protein